MQTWNWQNGQRGHLIFQSRHLLSIRQRHKVSGYYTTCDNSCTRDSSWLAITVRLWAWIPVMAGSHNLWVWAPNFNLSSTQEQPSPPGGRSMLTPSCCSTLTHNRKKQIRNPTASSVNGQNVIQEKGSQGFITNGISHLPINTIQSVW